MRREKNKLLNRYSGLYVCLFIFSGILSLVFTNCASKRAVAGSSTDRSLRKFLLRDEGLSQLCYVDLANSKANWYLAVPAGRDMQLVGEGRVLIGTGTGFEERDIKTGVKVHELTSFTGTIAARRLRNGNTLLVGLNWQGKEGIVLVEVSKAGTVQHLVSYPGHNYVRLIRQTTSGTFLVAADDTVFEGSPDGSIIWRVKLSGRDKPHAWQAIRLGNGQTIVSGGFTANFQLFGHDGKLIDTISGPESVKPHFYAGFQVLPNGNYVVTNWQGHGPKFGASGIQLLEYTPTGELAWSWKQDAEKFSSLQGVIVLDGLDVNFLHVEDGEGKLVPVKLP